MTVAVMAVVLVFVIKGREHVASGAGAFFVEATGGAVPEPRADAVVVRIEGSEATEPRLEVDPTALAVQTACWRASRALTAATAAIAPPP